MDIGKSVKFPSIVTPPWNYVSEESIEEVKRGHDDVVNIGDIQKGESKEPKSPGPQPQKTLFIFSRIFEKMDDIKNKPFVFEKHNLQKRKDYDPIKMQSSLIVPKKNSAQNQEPI